MTEARFKFISDAAGGDRFSVVSFSGHEAISTLYQYDIELKAPLNAAIDLDDVLDATARFVTEHDGTEYPVHGVLSSLEEFKTVQGYCYYRARLVPRVWKLSNYKTNEIFYQAAGEGESNGGLSVDTIIAQVLEKAGLSSSEFDLSGLIGNLLQREFRCQYNESDFDYISRIMENEGIFYYFEQGETEEKIVFINDQNYMTIPRAKLVFDVAAQAQNKDDSVHALSCRKQRLPENVIVRDYNPDEPSLDVSDITDIDSMGQGTEYIYGKNMASDTEATYLSQIRAEGFMCRKTQFFGESSVTRLQSGYLFSLDGHPNPKYNGVEYLAIEVNHEGNSLDMAAVDSSKQDARPQYQNSFVAIPADVQYRPPLKTPRPTITGTLHARIDGELESEYAQLDDQGRYKVSMPFDFHNEEHPEGLASARVRMMQPYAGKNRGMQFPMAKGTEVLLSFVDGDPDRPIIAGAINSVAAPGPVTADNQTESVIETGSHNKIRFEDEIGSERVMVESPMANSWIRVGATNDPITLRGESPLVIPIGENYAEPVAVSHSGPCDARVESAEFGPTDVYDYGTGLWGASVTTSARGRYRLKYESGPHTATKEVIVDEAVDTSGTDSDGIRIQSTGNLWVEAKGRTGDYITGRPADTGRLGNPNRAQPLLTHDMLAKMDNAAFYKPTNLLHFVTKQPQTFADAVGSGQVKVSSLDTITTQEGNIYDFGGYWNYNLGNSYAEDHLNQKAVLNADHAHDLLGAGGPGFVKDPNDPSSTGTASGWRAIGSGTSKVEKHGDIPAHPDSDSWKNIWVQKTFGDGYEYTEGSTISVTKGSSQEIEIGGVHVEEAYRGSGSIKSRSIRGLSDGRPAEEKKWSGNGNLVYHSTSLVTDESVTETEHKYDRANGALYSYSGSSGTGMSYSGFDFNFSNGAKASVDAGFRSDSDVYLLGKNSNSIFVGVKLNVELAAAGAIDIKNDSINASFAMLFLSTKTTEVDTKAAQIKSLTTKLNNHITEVDNSVSTIENNMAAIESAVIHLMN